MVILGEDKSMKILAFILLVSTQLAMADTGGKVVVPLSSDDSISLQDANIHLGNNEQTVDADGWTTYFTEFSSSDNSFSIKCSERNVMGSLIDQQCSVAVDPSLATSGVSETHFGEIGNSLVVILQNSNDISILKSILQGLPYYQTSENVSFVSSNKTLIYPRFRLDCDAQAKSCQAVLFP